MASWKKRLVAVSGGVVVALVIGELGLRALGVSFQDFYQADPVRGTAHRPGARGWFRAEGRQYIVINRAGFRDRDHAQAKPPGTFRIAVLGDSFTEALQVPERDAFWAVLERELAGCPALRGQTVEVLNFGVSNYGTAQELLTLRQRVWDYSPDLVLLAFFTGNDVRDNSRALKNDPEAPYYVLKDGALVLDDSFRHSARQRVERSALRRALRWCVESVRLLQLVRQAWGMARNRQSVAAQSGDEFALSWYQNPVYRAPTDPAWAVAWQVTERLLQEMRDEVRRHGARFLVVTLSNGPQVAPDPLRTERLRQQLDVPDLFHPDRRIQQLGEREGIAVLNLAPPFRDYAVTHRIVLHGIAPHLGTGHWNREGHHLAGRLIAQRVCALEGSEPPPARSLVAPRTRAYDSAGH